MVHGYRLVKKKWAREAFTGEGARLFGGRWNSRGYPCVYLAGSESLAMLEVMVHLESYALLHQYQLYRVGIAQPEVDHLGKEDIPDNWRDELAPEETAVIGNRWLDRDPPGLALAVPSIIVPRELNYLLNPSSPNYSDLVGAAELLDFNPDPRLL